MKGFNPLSLLVCIITTSTLTGAFMYFVGFHYKPLQESFHQTPLSENYSALNETFLNYTYEIPIVNGTVSTNTTDMFTNSTQNTTQTKWDTELEGEESESIPPEYANKTFEEIIQEFLKTSSI